MEKKESKKISKKELLEKMSKDYGMTGFEASKAFDAVFNTVVNELENGNEVSIKGFGSFKLNDMKSRTAVNPFNGKKIHVKAHKRVVFKVSSVLKEKVK